MPLKPRDVIDASDPRVAQIGHPAPPWMVNYADLMTELVCFYLILYALSAALSKPVQEAKKAVEETMKKEDVAGEVKITKDGLVISLQEQGYNVFFESGSAELSDQMKKILDGLAPTFSKLAAKNHDMIVEGHTDDVPIHSPKFSSNWELSTARATSVVQYLLHQYDYPPRHIAAIGYGENKSLPRAPTEDSVAWRSRNRRVVFVIKNPTPEPKEDKGEGESKSETR
ncbi:MAG: flagellar motor protein MotB [Elusimicrobia bacterium]|nr:flagellar motor protein MotB [Candidatus Obscuribacterium magneticum]